MYRRRAFIAGALALAMKLQAEQNHFPQSREADNSQEQEIEMNANASIQYLASNDCPPDTSQALYAESAQHPIHTTRNCRPTSSFCENLEADHHREICFSIPTGTCEYKILDLELEYETAKMTHMLEEVHNLLDEQDFFGAHWTMNEFRTTLNHLHSSSAIKGRDTGREINPNDDPQDILFKASEARRTFSEHYRDLLTYISEEIREIAKEGTCREHAENLDYLLMSGERIARINCLPEAFTSYIERVLDCVEEEEKKEEKPEKTMKEKQEIGVSTLLSHIEMFQKYTGISAEPYWCETFEEEHTQEHTNNH